MTEQGKPLSRRERRALEARAAGATSDVTEAIDPAAQDPFPPTDGLSRRDRRRIERSQQPMETWTAEEEMIATGQIPAMTPELIAEQERLAQEKAAEAAADAEAAAAELRAAFGGHLPVLDEPTAATPVRASAFARIADGEVASEVEQDSVPEWMRNESDAVPEPVVERSPAPVVEPTPEPEPVFVQDPEPEPEPEVVQAQDAVPVAPVVEAPADADSEDEFDDGIPAAFRGMFPPGSLQARAAAERRQQHDDAKAAAASTPDAADQVVAEQEVPQDPAEEIRRLTAQAMAGIEGSGAVASVIDDASDEPQAPVTPHVPETPAEPSPVEGDVLAEQTPWQNPWQTQEFEDEPQQAEPDPTPALAPHHASFDEVIAAQSGEVPLVEQRVDLNAQPAPPSEAIPTVAPSIWDAHPLDATDAQARELADAPSQAIPRPDFSVLATTTNPEHPAPFSPAAYAEGEPPLTTGSIEVARRKVPELHPAGGARHFRWAHIAVIGAIAFVLGVLVWNLAGQGS